MLRLRDQAERLLAVERDPDTTDDAVAQGIRELDEAYDRFTASYGRLNSKENLRVFDPNNSDPSLNQLYTLEKTGSDGFEAKGDMLSKRVVTPMPPMPEHVDEPVEALAVSLDRVGHVDLDLIGHLLGTRTISKPSHGSATHRHRPGRRHSTAGGRIPVRRRGRRTRPCRRTIACHGRRARTGTCTRMARRKRDTGHNTALARGKLP